MENKEKNEIVEIETKDILDDKKPLVIFKTEVDRTGRNIAVMSNFYDGYVKQLALSLKEKNELEIVENLPLADLGIINDVIHQGIVIMKDNVTLVPDFDSLSAEIKEKLKSGDFKIGDSKQVDGNLRAVIIDENNVRVKDITLKKVINNPGNLETMRSIGNQLQMRQLYAKLADIQEMQVYQLEKDRDRDIVVPFLEARRKVIEAETKSSIEERMRLYREADDHIGGALSAIYADVETTSKFLAKRIKNPIAQITGQTNNYMRYLTTDLQMATKFIGVRMQLLDYMGEKETAKMALQQYQHVMYDFLTEPVTKKGLTSVDIMQNYFPYDESNMNCWYEFSKEMEPALESSMKSLELSMKNDLYIISAEDITDEEE